jgi:hypothetical protein
VSAAPIQFKRRVEMLDQNQMITIDHGEYYDGYYHSKLRFYTVVKAFDWYEERKIFFDEHPEFCSWFGVDDDDDSPFGTYMPTMVCDDEHYVTSLLERGFLEKHKAPTTFRIEHLSESEEYWSERKYHSEHSKRFPDMTQFRDDSRVDEAVTAHKKLLEERGL